MMKRLFAWIVALIPMLVQAQVFYLVEYTGKTGNGHKAMVVYRNDLDIEVRHYHDSSGHLYVDHYESSETEDKNSKGAHLAKAEEAIRKDKADVELTVWATSDANAPVYIWYWDQALTEEEQGVPFVSFSMPDVLERKQDKWVKADSFRKLQLSELTDEMLDYYYSYKDKPEEKLLYDRVRAARDQAMANEKEGIMLTASTDGMQAVGITDGPTIHLIELTNDIIMDIGSQCASDSKAMRSEVRGIAQLLGMNIQIYDVSGDQFSLTGLKRALKQVKASNDDVIMFHYSGHGFRFDDQEDVFPQLSLCPTGYEDVLDNNFVGLTDIYEVLQSKGARLCMVLGDCCNSNIGTPRPITQTAFLSRDRTNIDVEKLKSLFLHSEGTVISSAASPGEVSWCDINGGMFTNAFLQSLRSEISLLSEGEPSWDHIISSTLTQAQTRSEKLIKAQHGLSKAMVLPKK